MKKKKIIFITGTRADFGKLKSLINKVEQSSRFEAHIFITGMHTLSKYGSTFFEVEAAGYRNIYISINQTDNTDMDTVLANTILGFGSFVKKINPDMIVIHGDRVEALAGSIVGSLNNILVAHVEGGEVSGTIDESIRHATTKFSHIHFAANRQAERRLLQLGEKKNSIFTIGSPDIDIMKSSALPSWDEVKKHYAIPFDNYGLCIYHTVTTELAYLADNVRKFLAALKASKKNYLIIYPNNDPGSDIIISAYNTLRGKRFYVLPSLRFEYFLTALKNADFIIGNSSAGIRQAEVYGTPAIDIGTRQNNRSKNKNIIHIPAHTSEILKAMRLVKDKRHKPSTYFGEGKSAEKFYTIITNKEIWETNVQKTFINLL